MYICHMTNESKDLPQWKKNLLLKETEKAHGSKRTFVEVRSTMEEFREPVLVKSQKALSTIPEIKPKKVKREDLVALGSIIQGVRKLIPITQQEMADHLGITTTAYANIEQGHAKTTWDTLYKICQKLGLKITIGGIEI